MGVQERFEPSRPDSLHHGPVWPGSELWDVQLPCGSVTAVLATFEAPPSKDSVTKSSRMVPLVGQVVHEVALPNDEALLQV